MIKYPRHLTYEEKYLIFSILPVNKSGYRVIKEKIESLVVTGEKNENPQNFFLGIQGTLPDTISPSSSVFALGTFNFRNNCIDIVIHEEIQNEIEIEIDGDISIVNPKELVKSFNFSLWRSGDKSPEKNGNVKEILIKPTPYILAITTEERKIWVHNLNSGVNTLIPVSNYYNSLMLFKNERKPGVALNPKLFFNNLDSYNNEDLVNAFVMYNKYMKRVLL